MVSLANTKSHPDYNPIFEKLVIGTRSNSKERLIGMLAYSDYKDEKYQWKEQYRKANSVEIVPADAVKAFLLAYHDGKLDKLRNDAEETLYVFAEHYSEKVSETVYKQALNDNLLKEVRTHNSKNYSAIKKNNASILSKIEKSYDGWWVAGLKGALGSTIFAAIALLVSIIFSVANPDTNYGRLVKFVIGQQEFLIIHPNDCRLKSANSDCIK
ncbi:hypothetical protein [Aliivibrio fischeri]|uniref:hypothetical protein n=1 Tax=Aliivibrio fischeri TaxID=668 RepID=UPI00084C421C|nr:hypothetical protein [Aliivibrio fischeri]OED53481.1 hypothetical protein BEI46_17610 [Aliivibrio fischeri]